jgi:hypothetical protein
MSKENAEQRTAASRRRESPVAFLADVAGFAADAGLAHALAAVVVAVVAHGSHRVAVAALATSTGVDAPISVLSNN